MLAVAVDDAEHPAAGVGPAADHRRGQAGLAGAPQHPEGGDLVGECRGDLPGAVGAVVVDHDELVGDRGAREDLVEPSEQCPDVVGLVEGGDDEAQVDVGVVVARDLLAVAAEDVDDCATGHGRSCAVTVGLAPQRTRRP